MPQYIDNNQLPIFYQDQPITKEQLDQLKNVFQTAFNNLYKVVIETQAPDIQRIQTVVDATQSLIISKLNQFDLAEEQITQITANLQSLLRQFSAIATSKANVTDLNTLYADVEALETRFNALADTVTTEEVILSNFSLRWDTAADTLAIRAITEEGEEPCGCFINKTLFVNVVADENIGAGRLVEFTGIDGTLGRNYRAKLANPNAEGFDPKKIIGVASKPIGQGQSGRVLIRGYLQRDAVFNLRDEGWIAGRLLYLDPTTTTGEITWATEENLETRIPRGQVRYRVGTVINSSNAEEALAYIQLDYAKALEEAYNVDPTDLQVNDMLILKETALGDLVWERIPLTDLTTKQELRNHEDDQTYNIDLPNKYHFPVDDARTVTFTVNPEYTQRTLNVSFNTLDELQEQFPEGNPSIPDAIYRLRGNLQFWTYENNEWVQINNYRVGSVENALFSVTELLRRFEQKADRATLRQDFDLETKYNLRTQGRSMVHWGNLINVPNLADDSWRSPIADYTLLPESDEINPVTVGDVIFVGADEKGKPAFYMCISSVQQGDEETEWDKFAQLDWDNNHNTLKNLTNQDDHTQYLLRDDTNTGDHKGLAGTLFFNDNQALDMVVHKSADNIGISQVEGKLWYSTSNNRLHIYSGEVNGWVPIQGAGAIIEEYEVDATEGQTVFDVGQSGTTFYEVGVRIMQVYRKVGPHYVLLDKDDFVETNSTTITLASAYVTANPVVAADHFYFRWANNVGGVESTILDGSVTYEKLAQPMKELVVPGADPLNEDTDQSTYVKKKDGTWVPAIDFDHNHEIVRKHTFTFPSTGWQPIDDGAEPVPAILYYQNSYTLPNDIDLSDDDYYTVRIVPADNEQATAIQSYGLYNDVEILSSDPVILRFRSEKDFDLANVEAVIEIVYEQAGVATVKGSLSSLVIDATQVAFDNSIAQFPGNPTSVQLAIEKFKEIIGDAGNTEFTFYVAVNGSDDNSGTQLAPFRTIRYACDFVATIPANEIPIGGGQTISVRPLVSIFINSGVYEEQLPIVVPSNTSLVGSDLRTVRVQPKAGLSDDGVTQNKNSTMFLMSSGTLAINLALYNMRGWIAPTDIQIPETVPAQGIGFALNPASPILGPSPYILDCSAFFGVVRNPATGDIIEGAGIGAYVDGSVHAIGNKSMLFYAYTCINDEGVGFWADNGGIIEMVSDFTYYAAYGYLATRGGYIRGLNGSNSWGTWALFAKGFLNSETPISGTLTGTMLEYSNLVGGFTAGQTIFGQTSGSEATILNVQESTQTLYIERTTEEEFQDGETIAHESNTANVVGTEFGQKGALLLATGFETIPEIRMSISLSDDDLTYVVASISGTWVNSSSVLILTLAQNKPTSSESGATIELRKRYSQIRVTGHDFLNVGSGGIASVTVGGGTLVNPGTAPVQSQQVGEFNTGRVFSVSTDQDGNFRVGKFFAIDQGTGRATLDASAFDLSGLTSLRLGSIGAQLGESINEFSSDVTLSQNSNEKVATQFAIKTYVDNKFSQNATFGENVTIEGNLTVQGTEVILNTETVNVEDKNIVLGNIDTPTDITADGGGITLKGDTDKTIVYNRTNNRWDSNTSFNAPQLFVNGEEVGTATVYEITILSDVNEWANVAGEAPFTQTITVTGIKSTDFPFADVNLATIDFEDLNDILASWGLIYRGTTQTNQITFFAKEIPEVNIPVVIRR
jgi:hypothetical protein